LRHTLNCHRLVGRPLFGEPLLPGFCDREIRGALDRDILGFDALGSGRFRLA
jgi:hypothetical protein